MPRSRRNSATDLQAEEEQVVEPSPIRRSTRILARRASADSDDDHKSKLRQSSPFNTTKTTRGTIRRSTRSSDTSSVEEEPLSDSAKKIRGRKPVAIEKQDILEAIDETEEDSKKSTPTSNDASAPKKQVKQNLFKKVLSDDLYGITELAEVEDLPSEEGKATLSQDKLENGNSEPIAEKTDSTLKDNEVTGSSQNIDLKESNTPKKPEENSVAMKDVHVVLEKTKEKSTNPQKEIASLKSDPVINNDSQDMNIKEPNNSEKLESKNVTVRNVQVILERKKEISTTARYELTGITPLNHDTTENSDEIEDGSSFTLCLSTSPIPTATVIEKSPANKVENIEEETVDSGVAVNVENNSFDSNTSDKENIKTNLNNSENTQAVIETKKNQTALDETRAFGNEVKENSLTDVESPISKVCSNNKTLDASVFEQSINTDTEIDITSDLNKSPNKSAEQSKKTDTENDILVNENKSPSKSMAIVLEEYDSSNRENKENNESILKDSDKAKTDDPEQLDLNNDEEINQSNKSDQLEETTETDKNVINSLSTSPSSNNTNNTFENKTETVSENETSRSKSEDLAVPVKENIVSVPTSQIIPTLDKETDKQTSENIQIEIGDDLQDNSVEEQPNDDQPVTEEVGSSTDDSKESASCDEQETEDTDTSAKKKEDLDSKLDALVENADFQDDSDSDASVSDYIDDMAEEAVASDTPSEGSNDIIDEGESINSTESEYGSSNEYEEDDSFIDDTNYELLSGNESFDETTPEEKTPKKKEGKWNRIVQNKDSDSENDEIPETPATAKQEEDSLKENSEKKKDGSWIRIVQNEDSDSENEENIAETPAIASQEEASVKEKPENDESPPAEKKLESTTTNLRRVSSITILENVSVDEIEDKDLSQKISEAVRLLYTPQKPNSRAIKLNVSVDLAEGNNTFTLPKDTTETEKKEQTNEKEHIQNDSKRSQSSVNVETPQVQKIIKEKQETIFKDKKGSSPKVEENKIAKKKSKDNTFIPIKKNVNLEPENLNEVKSILKKKNHSEASSSIPETKQVETADKIELIELILSSNDSENEVQPKSSIKKKKKNNKSVVVVAENNLVPSQTHKKMKDVSVVKTTELTDNKIQSRKRKHLVENVTIEPESLPSKRATYENVKVDYFPCKLLAEVLKGEEEKTREKRMSKVVTRTSIQTSWNTEVVNVKPSCTNNLKEKSENNITEIKKKRNKRKKLDTNAMVPSKKSKIDSNIHVKDYKSQMLFNSSRVKRMDTKVLLRKKQKNA